MIYRFSAWKHYPKCPVCGVRHRRKSVIDKCDRKCNLDPVDDRYEPESLHDKLVDAQEMVDPEYEERDE